MSCLEETDVALFFEGQLDAARIEELELHLDGCTTCLALVAAAGPALDRGSPDAGPSGLLRVGDLLADRYEIRAVLGAGATGYVYRAHDHLVDTTVAVKVLRPGFGNDPACVRTFVAELQVARRLIHPNVCRIFDLQQTGEHTFLTMELASGGSLRDELARSPARPRAGRVKDALALTRGLAAMHAVGLVHRDVKPGNVLRAADGRIVLSDFGLAFVSAITANPARPVGTPPYMAPEVAAGAPASPRSDVWSLGVTLHELLLGERPGSYSGPPDALERLCRDCLAADPDHRPADGGAVLAHLLRIQQGPPRRRGRGLALALGMAAVAGGASVVALKPWSERAGEVTLTLTIAPPKNHGGATPAQMKRVEEGLARTRSRLQGTPWLKILSEPPARPGVDDWTLELWVEPHAYGVSNTFWVVNGEGTRRNIGSGSVDWGEGWRGKAGAPFLVHQLIVFASDVRRWRWAERGTDKAAARATLKTLLERPGDRNRLSPSMSRGLLDLALAEDASYLAAHVERALVTAREALLPSGGDIGPSLLLAEAEKLAQRAPSDPHALLARCRLLEVAVRISAEPAPALISSAVELCRRATRAAGIGHDAWLSLAQIQALTCEPKAALDSIHHALAHPSRLAAETLYVWGALALREHWAQAKALDGWTMTAAMARPPWEHERWQPPLPLLVGSLWLREGSLDRARSSFGLASQIGIHEPEQEAVLAEGRARAQELIEPQPDPPGAGTAVGPSDTEIARMVAKTPGIGPLVVETLSWTAPERARKLLETLGPPGTCLRAIERAMIRRSLGDLDPADTALPACRSNAAWVERCRQHLRQPLPATVPPRG